MRTNFSRTTKLMAVLALVLFLAGTALAQRLDGTLNGDVMDPQGAVVPDAKITITNEATGVSQSTQSTSVGSFTFPNVLVAVYTVKVEKQGFRTYENKGVAINANQVTEVHAKLTVGVATETIEVTAGAALVETTTSQLTTTYQMRLVGELPLAAVNANALELAVLGPNTTTAGGGVIGQGGSVGGSRPRTNSFTIDGVDDNNVGITGPLTPVIPESVAELDLLTNQFSAEYGNGSGGQFNIVTKSGTNAVHGQAYEYFENRHLNARTNLQKASPTKPRFDFNRLGVDIGGPIVKDKVFFFAGYQYQTEGLEATPVTINTPTGAGIGLLNTIATSQGFTTIAGVITTFMPVAAGSSGTQTVHDPNAATGPCVPGPAPNCLVNIPIGPVQFFAPTFFSQHDFNTNVDANLGKHSFRARFLYDRFRAPNVNPELPIPAFNGSQKNDNRKLLLSDVWVINPRWINDFRVSYSRNINGFSVPETAANFPNFEIDTLGVNIGPEGNSPQGGGINTYQILDNVSWIHGKHSFKFGVQAINWIAPSLFLPRARGEWDYKTLDGFVNDLVPNGANGGLRGAGASIFAGNQHGFFGFAQDDYKITSRLTLNLGLRYEWVSIARDSGTQVLNAISNCAPADPATCPAFYTFGKPKSDTNNFSPRAGFAWDPTGSGKWAIRGGGMIAFDKSPQNFALLSLPPQLQTEQNPTITCSGAAGPPPAWCLIPTPFAYTGSNYAPNLGRGFIQFGGLAQINVPCATQADCRASTQGKIVDYTQPKSIVWSLSVERELFKNTKIELRYLGTRGISLPVQVRTNTQTGFDVGLPGLPTFLSAGAVPATVPLTSPTTGTWDDFLNCNVITLCPLRFASTGWFGLVTAFPPIGQSTYHSGSVDFTHNFDHGLYLRANYTWAHTIDNATNELFSSRVNPRRPESVFWPQLPGTGNQLRGDRGNSVLDISQKFALSAVYDFPNVHLESGFGRALLHDWTISATVLEQKGQPITALSGFDANGNFDSAGDRAIINPAGIPNTGTDVNFVCFNTVSGATSIGGSPDDCSAFNGVASSAANNFGDNFIAGYVAQNPNARFVAAQEGAVSNVGRNTITTPGFNLVDMGVSKKIHIHESAYVVFRVDTLNLLNHRNFAIGAPSVFESDANALSTSLPFVTSGGFLNFHDLSGGSRLIQLGVKLVW